MNKPSQYIPLWDKIKKEGYVVIRTPFPLRLKRAISKRKHLSKTPGKLLFRVLKHVEINGDGEELVEMEINLDSPKNGKLKHI